MRLIKNVLLDLNNVGENYSEFERKLPIILPRAFDKIADHLGIKPDKDYFNEKRMEYSIVSGDNPFQHYPAFWQHIFEPLIQRSLRYEEIEKLYSIYLDEYEENIDIYSDFISFQERCKLEGFKTGIVANGNTHRVYRFLQKYNLLDKFDTIIASGSSPFAKPNPSIFKLALLNNKSLPVESVFIGDRPDTDIAGANKSGIWTIRLRRGPAKSLDPKNVIETGDFTVDCLDEIFDLPILALEEEITSVVIPCGGRGTRMGEMTSSKQKCMIELDGTPILGRVVNLLRSCGIKEFHFIVGYRSEDILNYFGDGDRMGVKVYYHHPNQPSTGLAFLSILDKLPPNILYCHANILFQPNIFSNLLKEFYKSKSSTFAITKIPVAHTHPVFILNNGVPTQIKRFANSENIDKVYYSMGLGIIATKDINNSIESFSVEDITTEQLLSKSVSTVKTIEQNEPWFHLETMEDFESYVSLERKRSLYG